MKILTGKIPQSRRCLLYAVHGIGKSTWAASAPNCIILNIEDGLNDVECNRTEHLTTMDGINESLMWLANNKHDFKNIAIDSVDWLEAIIHADVAKAAGKSSIADIGYAAGYKQALPIWDKLLFKLDWLRTEKKMNVIFIAHTAIVKHSDPEHETYDRYQPALDKHAAAMLMEYCDEILFASYRVFIRKEDQGFNKERAIAVDGNERYVRTQETASCLAKNRLGMPPEIEFSWAAYQSHFPA